MMASSHRALETNVPRYTSYPTAPHFHSGVNATQVGEWLDAISDGEALSLYLHIPYCDRLCWFCACHTKQTLRYEPVATYLEALKAEIRTIGGRIAGRAVVRAIHWGGGSPTMLKPEDMQALRAELEAHFCVAPDAEFSVEIEPNDMDAARLETLAAISLTRASLGVQDFDARVQQAINREQSFALTASVVHGLRAHGIASINLDLLYGLPHQTLDTLAATLDQALSLRPDRIALFGYAHVPWFKKHQTMIDETVLPNGPQRLEQSLVAAARIAADGYTRIGIDHFALPQDSLARAAREGRLRRNFQGYTDDSCETLIGLGPSSVSRYRQGYAQNTVSTSEYGRIVSAGELAAQRGIALSTDDRVRGWTIERLMCDFAFDSRALTERFGASAMAVLAEAAVLSQNSPQSGLRREGDRFVIEDRMQARLVAAMFDPYFTKGNARHSAAV
ncbi:MAG: oxygen-independent coproporphyrinogen III oxidase [Rhizobiaceae bacterium]|nr:oxygen-independent coproporphyrinogen III oxidase [Rhizobiaceae bacterium]